MRSASQISLLEQDQLWQVAQGPIDEINGLSGTSLSTGKFKLLHVGRNNPRHQSTPANDLPENGVAEKDLWGLVNIKLNMSQQCSFRAKVDDDILGKYFQLIKRGVLSPLLWMKHHLELGG